MPIPRDTTTVDWLYKPSFPAEWHRKSLYCLAKWVNGLAFRNIQFCATGKPVIKITEIKKGISNQTKFTRQIFDDSVRVRSGDLLFSWSGQPETSIDAFWWGGCEGWLNQHIFRVTPSGDVDTVFFYYLLKYLKPNFVGIARNKQTTGLGHVTKSDLKGVEVGIPTVGGQRAIAHILGTLDDKIELNQQMNNTLEEMARALFKSWFVDFDPVRAKSEGRWRPGESLPGLPADLFDLFPNRLVDSQLGPIPDGWQVKALDEIAAFRNGLALQKYRPKQGEGRLPVVKIAQLREGRVGQRKKEWASAAITPECIIEDGDVVFSWSGSLMVRIWCGGRAALNQHLFKVTSSEYPKWFYLHWTLTHLDSFTTMGHIKRQHLSESLCAVPSNPALMALSVFYESLVAKIVLNQVEARSLEMMRDALLPRLMSGQMIPDKSVRKLSLSNLK